ncbi:hypothetical protein LDL79_10905 [Leeuwenhoekiella palythoae]|uniref:Nuclease-like protein n=1 Tax=Galbibacter orientalis DSM 19592 TaxID=926559 RepID=I3C8D9_9FLAO|nr:MULTISPECIES: hypothetical protein [Flavobacteriaceae]EIJ39882.1 hypothetical protein JoomaDRAFT_2922 [Galbibacter orientalis DSM 19592]UBZ09310.1 hypothetical protein LDL79_10905 [Leeuwenhoekiella palythoae]
MPIDIEQKSRELKEYVSVYDTKTFLGDLSTLLLMVPMQHLPESIIGLVAPQRQIFYLAGLHLTSEKKENAGLKYQYTPEEWEQIKALLIEIEQGYEEHFYPTSDTNIDDLWLEQRKVGLLYHLNYFNQGDLNYEEQIIERIKVYFTPFDREIRNHFGLSVEDFISIYLFLDEMLHQKLNTVFAKEDEHTWDDISIEQFAEGIMNPIKMKELAPPSYIRMSESVMDPGKKYRFTIKELSEHFDEDIIKAFVSILSYKRQVTEYLFYTESNPYFSHPIFESDDGSYQSIDIKQIIIAIYNRLLNYITGLNIVDEKFYKHRGVKLENKIVKLFRSVFGNDIKVYQGYYTELGNEQDILILYKGIALIIEAKASKRREPRSDPDKAYDLIKKNFDKVIQKGYDQAYRVKKRFINGDTIKIYSDLALIDEIAQIKTKNYHHAFSCIVTLERFGQIQTDLNDLLVIEDDDEFPLSICIDDLEVFLLAFKKRGSKFSELLRYFDAREYLHGGLLCSDELEICGAIITKTLTDKILKSDEPIRTDPDHAQLFDDYYAKGLGFENEINLERKTSGKFLNMFR